MSKNQKIIMYILMLINNKNILIKIQNIKREREIK